MSKWIFYWIVVSYIICIKFLLVVNISIYVCLGDWVLLRYWRKFEGFIFVFLIVLMVVNILVGGIFFVLVVFFRIVICFEMFIVFDSKGFFFLLREFVEKLVVWKNRF